MAIATYGGQGHDLLTPMITGGKTLPEGTAPLGTWFRLPGQRPPAASSSPSY